LQESLKIADISVDEIVTGKSQARGSQLEKGIEDLVLSLDKWGLLEPITVFLNDDKKYEILAGQRRYTAAKKLGWKTIPATIRPKPKDEFEAKALSLAENVTSNPMTVPDIMDACDVLMKRYNDTKLVAEAIGISVTFVNKYVKYSRLPEILKKAVDSGQLNTGKKNERPEDPISLALKAVEALKYRAGGHVSEEKLLELAKIMRDKTATQQNDIVEEAQKDPEREVNEIVKKADNPSKKRKILKLGIDDEQLDRLDDYREKSKKGSTEDAALDLIAEGLDRAGF
jgi:ParB/RepB/Spo0J family partition protein